MQLHREALQTISLLVLLCCSIDSVHTVHKTDDADVADPPELWKPLFTLASATADAVSQYDETERTFDAHVGGATDAATTITVPLATPPVLVVGLNPARGVFDPSV